MGEEMNNIRFFMRTRSCFAALGVGSASKMNGT